MGLGLRAKLMGSFGAVLVLLALVGIVGYSNTTQFAEDFSDLYQDSLVPSTQLSNVQEALYELRVGAVMFASLEADGRAKVKADEGQWLTQLDTGLKALSQNVHLSAEEATQVKALQAASADFVKARVQTLQFAEQGNIAESNRNRSEVAGPAFARSMDSIHKLHEVMLKGGADLNQSVQSQAGRSIAILIGLTVAALVFGLGVAFFLARSITRSVSVVQQTVTSLADKCASWLADGLRAMAQGDLTVGITPVTPLIEGYGKDELGQLSETTNKLRNNVVACIGAYEESRSGLQGIVSQVREAAGTVADTSQQLGAATSQTSSAVQQVTHAVQSVAAGAQETSRSAQSSSEAIEQLAQVVENVAQGSQEQARQIQTASDTTNKMAANIQKVAADAQSVAAASVQTRASAEHGASAVRETVVGMREIKSVVTEAAAKVEELGRLGDKIGAVVETIDDIAEQTNLLALNAAIEAARAGEHGRGFAVVADEVRKLAERSQRETKAIGELIIEVQAGTRDAVKAMETGSVKVEQGSQKADQAGDALSQILEAVQATVTQVGGIATAAQDMSAGAQSVVDTMHSLSAVVEESSAATEEMAAQAGQVTGAIQSIAAVSEENSAATEEVSASAEEMTAQVEEMTAQADDLASTAEQLRELVARFRLESAVERANDPVARRRDSDWSQAPKRASSLRAV
ncbi:MAG: methyl-accepting chemotaxis protein [Chloroflexota bacterium]